jgi:Ni,Fe-hydrogenase III large subunit
LRYLETVQSLKFVIEHLDNLSSGELSIDVPRKLKPESLTVSMVEGWRGEIVHVAATDKKGKLIKYKIKDPSFNNWMGLALAVRNNEISDFPLCNKSFNLSYCGFDL